MGWEEVIDGRCEARDAKGALWTHLNFEDSLWLSVATTSLSSSCAPHRKFAINDLPFLTDEWREPVQRVAQEIVRPAPYLWTIDIREALAPEDQSANPIVGSALLTTFLYSPLQQEIIIGDPHNRGNIEWQLNNRPLSFDDNEFVTTGSLVAKARLNEGWNRLMVRLNSPTMFGRVALCLWAKPGVRTAIAPKADAAEGWLLVGPQREQVRSVEWGGGLQSDPVFPATASAHARDLQGSWDDKEWPNNAGVVGGVLLPDWICTEDIYARSWSDRKINAPESLHHHGFHGPGECEIPYHAEGDTRLLLDFGEELIGETEVSVIAAEGTIIDGIGFEFIQRDGRLNLPDGVNNSFRYICREGRQVFRTTQRRGYRYLWLVFRGMKSSVHLISARTRFSTYPQARLGSFFCSDEQLNRIWQVGAHSLRCCSEDTYTDCPTYEQVHWIGDARNEALIDLVVNGDARLSRHCWFQAARSLERSPIVESQVPSGWRVLIPSFTWLWLDWAAWHYAYTGDKQTALEMLPWIKQQLKNVEDLLSTRGLFEMPAWNMIDWAPMDTPSTGAVTHVNALLAWGAERAAWLAESLDCHAEAKTWRALGDRVRVATNRLLWNEKRSAYADSCDTAGVLSKRASFQTQIVAVLSGLAIGERLECCREQLGLPWTEGRMGSPFFAGFVLEGLIQENRWPEAYERMLSYWGQQIEEGATAFWEMFQPWETRLTRSHCHGWAGIPCFFVSRECLGVQPLMPGFGAVRIAPQLHGLQWAEGTVPIPEGAIHVSWRYNNAHFQLNYSSPSRRLFRIELPKKMTLLKASVEVTWREPGYVLESCAAAAEFTFMSGDRLSARMRNPDSYGQSVLPQTTTMEVNAKEI
jgi:hypothetical protein